MQLFVLQFSSPPDGIKATARHILVKSPEQVDVVMEKLSDGVPFASVAADFSTCPSKSQGGSLGSFGPGTMVGEYNNQEYAQKTGEAAVPTGKVLLLLAVGKLCFGILHFTVPDDSLMNFSFLVTISFFSAEFDKVIFDPETKLGEVVGPVQTQFGYHLIVVDKRTGV